MTMLNIFCVVVVFFFGIALCCCQSTLPSNDTDSHRKLSAYTDPLNGQYIRTSYGIVPHTSCQPGYYRPPGSSDMVDVTGPHSDGCVACPVGRYGSTSGLVNAQCTAACPLGTYSDVEGISSSLQCKLCPIGRYGSTVGLTSASCTAACPVGRYSSIRGAYQISQCSKCPTGYRGWQCTWAIAPRSGQVQDHMIGSTFGYKKGFVDPLKQLS